MFWHFEQDIGLDEEFIGHPKAICHYVKLPDAWKRYLSIKKCAKSSSKPPTPSNPGLPHVTSYPRSAV
jgi:hypothetical protein